MRAQATEDSMKTTVAIFFYRRPEMVAALIGILRHHRPPRIWLIADGPREGSMHEKELCLEARKVADTAIDWPCEIRRVYAETHLGLRQRFESGLDELFSKESEAIILEEDCHPLPDFFPFCEEMLARYRREVRVGGVSGNCFLPRRQAVEADYFFSRYLHIWGWATWARAWHAYDRNRWAWPAGGFRHYFPKSDQREVKYWNRIFGRLALGKFSTWDYPWASSFWRAGWVSITPCQNLVQNVGFGPDATNTRDLQINTGIEREDGLPPPYRGPQEIQADEVLDRLVFENHFLRTEGRLPLWPRLFRSLRKRLSRN